jgi:hypothetical protein
MDIKFESLDITYEECYNCFIWRKVFTSKASHSEEFANLVECCREKKMMNATTSEVKCYEITEYNVTLDFSNCDSLQQLTQKGYRGTVEMLFRIMESCSSLHFHANSHFLNIQGIKLEQNRRIIDHRVHSTVSHLKKTESTVSKKEVRRQKYSKNKKNDNISANSQQNSSVLTLHDSIITVTIGSDASSSSSSGNNCLQIGKAKLTVSFATHCGIPMSNESLFGLYYLKNSDMIQTHFEPHYAHYVFPCIDSFDAKAQFSLILANVPTKKSMPYTIVSNASIDRQFSNNTNNSITAIFEKTPIISPYLLYFCISPNFTTLEFSLSEGRLPIRIFYEAINASSGLLVKDIASKAIPVLESYFDMPINNITKKLDFVLVSEYCFGGMEHHGCIVLHVNAPANSNHFSKIKSQDAFCGLICHELAHFYVGNYVSFPIHIKEGLAQYFELLVADKILSHRNDTIGKLLKDIENGVVNTVETNKRMASENEKSLKQQFSDMFNGISYTASLNSILELIHRIGGQKKFQIRMRDMISKFGDKYLNQEEFISFICDG